MRIQGLVAATALTLAAGCVDPTVGEPVEVALDTEDPDLKTLLDGLVRSARQSPNSGDMRGRLGMAYEVNDFKAAARETYAQAHALDGGDFRWPYFQALLIGKAGDLEQAAARMELALSIDDGYVPGWLSLGAWRLALGRHSEARSAFLRAQELGADVNARAGLGQVLLNERRLDEAVELLEPLSEELQHPHVYRLLGRAYQAQGRTEDARIPVARGRRATPLEWRDPLQRQKWGFLASYGGRLVDAERLLGSGQAEAAVAVLEPMVARYSSDQTLMSNLAIAYARTGDRERALETLRRGFADDLDHFRFHNAMASLLHIEGDLSAARHHLKRSIAVEAVQVWPYERLGALSMQAGLYEDALAAYEAALRHGVDRQEQVYYQMGLIEGVRESWPAAIGHFERATSLDAAFTMAFVHLGRCLAEAGRFDEAHARLAWAERLGTHPQDVASARARLGDLEAESS